ncbi:MULTISPECIES: HdeD family acid-resistance protein [Microbacterium]|uniref:Uncharacterized membrane protein HdeD, DUF308 family n=1 Tax=Microbacterium saccharophilum TaxID=1213358 RepID=A0A7Z7D0R4_9MICO|nr:MULTISPECIES: DUF308 domain-containing protein [Microbacterium]SFI34356.1 Uncharacterized membrane protein HdeD, DUF308 family [Microbacterium saccharophilum]
MTTDTDLGRPATDTLRAALGISGMLALIAGLLILIWPGKTALVVAGIVAIYAIASGLAYAALGLFSRNKGGWARVGHVVLGLIFIVAGIVAFANLTATAVWLAAFLGILVGIMWIIEGLVSLSTLGASGSRIWTVIFAVLSIIAGIMLLFSPLWGAVVLWWLLGIGAVVLGITNIVRAVTYGR